MNGHSGDEVLAILCPFHQQDSHIRSMCVCGGGGGGGGGGALERWDNERLCAMETPLRLNGFPFSTRIEARPLA